MNYIPLYEGRWNQTYHDSIERKTLLRSRRISGRKNKTLSEYVAEIIRLLLGSLIMGAGVIGFFTFAVLVLGC